MRELRDLALRYGILTDYTSYLVQEPSFVVRGRGDPVPVMGPPPASPRDQAGAGQIAKAEEQAALRSSVHLNAVVVTGAAEAADSVISRQRTRGAPEERIGARLFLLKDSVWIDTHHGDSLRVVTVAPFSPAYFSLLHALPELVQPAALQPAVLVAGRRVSMKIQEGGLETWREGELTRLVREFR
jgi:hypothetical protein